VAICHKRELDRQVKKDVVMVLGIVLGQLAERAKLLLEDLGRHPAGSLPQSELRCGLVGIRTGEQTRCTVYPFLQRASVTDKTAAKVTFGGDALAEAPHAQA